MEAVEKLDEQIEAVADPLLDPPGWVEPEMDKISDQNIRDWDNLSSVTEAKPEGSTLAPEETPDETQYFGVYTGIASGNTLNMGSSTIHSYRIYGRCSPPKRGEAVVQIGYLKAF
jgi:hypothetical protein